MFIVTGYAALKAMFLLSLMFFFRMGEICIKSGSSADLVIQRYDLSFMYYAGKVTGISITIRQFKSNLK